MRLRLAVVISVVALAGVSALDRAVEADLENQVFTSPRNQLRMVVPRGWRASDQPTYPGLLLWMMRDDPEGRMVLTARAFTREVYCSWPVTCRTSHELTTMSARLACALRHKLERQRLHLGPVQAGPKENVAAGLPSVWFEYDDGKHFVRQAVALSDDRVVSLLLTASSSAARATHVRAFEQALRSLRSIAPEALAPASAPGAAPRDAGAADAGPLPDAALAGSASFESAPAPKVDPIGSCAQQ